MNKPPNENDARGGAARQFLDLTNTNKPHVPAEGKPEARGYEDRRNAAACFPNRDKSEEWQCDYQGVLVAEKLQDGARVWVNVHQRTDRTGRPYLSVVLKQWRSETK